MDLAHFGDAVTLDQLRVLVAVVDAGTFQGAARQLRRAQGGISYNIAQLETLLGLTLFARQGRRRVLTGEGESVVSHARDVLAEMYRFRAAAKGMGEGLEPSLAIAVDAIFPMSVLTQLIDEYRYRFATVPLSVHTAVLGEVLEHVQAGMCSFGITGTDDIPNELQQRIVGTVEMVAVVAPKHPLATSGTEVSDVELERHVHIVVGDRSTRPVDRAALGFESTKRWNVFDFHARHELIVAGLGWARLPHHQIANDLRRGTLVEFFPARWVGKKALAAMRSIHAKKHPPGPAGRWFLEQLDGLDHADLKPRE